MISEEILQAIESCASRQEAHVIDVNIRGSKNKSIVEIFVDAKGNVTSEVCSGISRDVAEFFDLRDAIKGPYQLIVSSPGIDRPLKFAWQYAKHVGRNFVVTLQTGQKHEGKLVGVEDESVTLEEGKQHEHIQVRFDAIHEAKVKAPW